MQAVRPTQRTHYRVELLNSGPYAISSEPQEETGLTKENEVLK
jgi:hypothetical protein